MCPEKKLSSMYLMHLTGSKAVLGGKLLTSHLTDLGLISTGLASPCKVDLKLLCCLNICSKKGCGSVLSAETPCSMGQEELLILLVTIFPKALLGFLLTIYFQHWQHILKPFRNRLYFLLKQWHCHPHWFYYHLEELYSLCWLKNWFIRIYKLILGL